MKAIVSLDDANEGFSYAEKLIAETDNSVFLTGKAGTGKSTFLRHMARRLDKSFAIVAPTGIAAINVRGVTIHSLFQLPFGPILPYDERIRSMRFNPDKLQVLQELEVLIIDEISMVRADTLDAMDKVLRLARKRLHLPFGGVQLLMVGDLLQLEPVMSRDEKPLLLGSYETPFFFSADVIREMDLINIELTTVYRQEDPDFVALLNSIRNASAGPAELNRINDRMYFGDALTADDFVITLATTRRKVDFINEGQLSAIDRPLHTFEGKIEGDFPLGQLPTDRKLQLKEGAQVMFVKNDSGEFRRWANGTLGMVESIDEDGVKVRLESGRSYTIKQVSWDNISYEHDAESGRIKEKIVGTYTQLPVKLAWAITIHKSQGLTFEKIILDMGRGAFAAGQLYVALSRCTSLNGIFLRTEIRPSDMIIRDEVLSFYERNNDMQQILKALDPSG